MTDVVNRSLRDLYGDVLSEPLPDSFAELLAGLDAAPADPVSDNGQKGDRA